jgi:hypothetical protein
MEPTHEMKMKEECAKYANSCPYCQEPLVYGQTHIMKVIKCDPNKTVMWICQSHINDFDIAPDVWQRDEERSRLQQQAVDNLGPYFVEIDEGSFRVWPRTRRTAKYNSICSLPSCDENVRGSRIVGSKKFEPSMEKFTKKLDVFGRETRYFYWICASHFDY